MKVVNPLKLDEVKEAIEWGINVEGPAVIITRWPCVLKKLSAEDKAEFGNYKATNVVDHEKMCIRDREQISNCTYRQFTTGFFYGKPDENAQIYDNNTYVKEYTYLGFVEELTPEGMAQITQKMCIRDSIMSGDPTYITSYKGARSMIMKVERDELVEELLTEYIRNRSWEK